MIRKLTKEDKQTYLMLAREFYRSGASAYSANDNKLCLTFDELMRSDDYAACFLAEEGGQAQGFVLVAKTFSQEAGGLVVWIEELYVKDCFRKRGVATALLDFVEKIYVDAKRFRLEVEEGRDAQKLYTSLGYEFMPYLQMKKGN